MNDLLISDYASVLLEMIRKIDIDLSNIQPSCGCKPFKKYESRRLSSKKWWETHAQQHYLLRMDRYFQNPLYQWIQEFITTEGFTHYQTFKKQAKNY